MDRREEILKYITKEQLGIEIGPFCWPLTPKREGYNCLVMDVFDTAFTRARAAENPNLSEETVAGIEAVDLVGSSTLIDEIIAREGRLGQFDYIVSSHNFEHLPNPIRFLQGCAKVLKPGGIISMAIPDHRACYDYFRPVTRLSDWLDAWLQDRHQPTFAQSFDDRWVRASYDQWGVAHGSFFQGADPSLISSAMTMDSDFRLWEARLRDHDTEYHDAHCSVFTPSSLELLLRDGAWLGLIPFEVVDIHHSPGVDIFVHLRRLPSEEAARPANYQALRNEILHRMLDEGAHASTMGYRTEHPSVDSCGPQSRDSELQRELDEAKRNAQEAQTSQRQLQNALASAEESERRLNAALAALRESTSWRITAPIRKLRHMLRKPHLAN